jgi:hypothetical protein
MLPLFPCLLSLAYGDAFPIKREKESSEVKSPTVGDTIALTEPRYDEPSLNISCIAPQATANRPSSTSLVQENNLLLLALLNVINGTQLSLTYPVRDIAL